MNIKRLIILTLATVALVSLAACGGSGGPPPLDVTIKAKDIAFDVTAFEVKKGQTVNVTYENIGALEHNFVFKEFNVNEKAQPGQTITFSFTPSSEGTFTYYCNIAGHTEAGMVGTLTVTP
jgi:plastocyanin